jgi:nitrile hydratase accessory protein
MSRPHDHCRGSPECAIPVDQRTPTFNEPWEAQAFALTLALHRRGAFTWGEWAATLGEEIKRAQASGRSGQRHHLLPALAAAIERMVREKGITTEDTLDRYRDAWHRAADRTPHGEPIVLSPGKI